MALITLNNAPVPPSFLQGGRPKELIVSNPGSDVIGSGTAKVRVEWHARGGMGARSGDVGSGGGMRVGQIGVFLTQHATQVDYLGEMRAPGTFVDFTGVTESPSLHVCRHEFDVSLAVFGAHDGATDIGITFRPRDANEYIIKRIQVEFNT